MANRVFQQLDKCAGYPYPKREYVLRALWEVVEATLIRWSPRRALGWRRFWLRMFGARVAPTSHTRPSARIKHPWLITLGEYATLSDGVVIYNLGPVSIGDHAVLSQDVYVCAGSHDYTRPDLPLTRPSITVGRGAWVCAGAFLGPGVHVGDNAIVGARAVVMKDVPEGAIVGGNPARVVKQRPMDAPPIP